MTAAELKNFIRATRTSPLTLAQELEVFDALVDFISQALTNGIPDWTNALTFQTDGTDDGIYSINPDTNGKIRFWKTKVDDNINHQPPTNPVVTEDTYWIEVSPSPGSAIKEWAPGIYGDGLIIVYYGNKLYKLETAVRPYESTDIVAELADENWVEISGGAAGLTGFTSAAPGEFYADTTKTRWYERPLTEHSALTSGNSTVLTSSEIANGESITIEILHTFKSVLTNDGGGGRYICTWTKQGGALVKSWESDTDKGNNTGDTVNVSTIDSGGNIQATWTRVAASDNSDLSWIARIIHRKL